MKTLKEIVDSSCKSMKIAAAAVAAGAYLLMPNHAKAEPATNAADVRGTWYEHGSTGGWYGPYKEYNFHFLFLKQDGTNIQGEYQSELYPDRWPITGSIESSNLTLTITYTDKTHRNLKFIINGDDGRSNWPPVHIERVSKIDFYLMAVPPKKEK